MREYRALLSSLPPEFPEYMGDEITGALTTAGFDLTRSVWWFQDYDAQEIIFYQYSIYTASELIPLEQPGFILNRTPPFQGFRAKTAHLDMNCKESIEDFGARVDAILADFFGGPPSPLVSAQPLDPSEA